MKHFLSFLFFIIAVTIPLLSSASVQYSFTYTYEGQTVKYYIKNDGTCTTAKCDMFETAHDIKGKLILPAYPKDGSQEYKLTTIGANSFYENDELEYVEIPNTVTTIENRVFQGCDKLSTVILPNSVTKMYSEVFDGCINLKNISLPESLQDIYTCMFRGCTNLESIEIPGKVKKIWDWAFKGCTSLTTLIIPNSVKTIGNEVFENCSGLKSIILGTSVSSLGKDVFSGCSPVKFAYPNTLSENPFVKSGSILPENIGAYNPKEAILENGWIYGPEKNEIRYAPVDLEGEYIIPESIQSIGKSAFFGCKKLTSVKLHNSLQRIDDYAFYDCSGIKESLLVIPRSVNVIGKSAFYNCEFNNIILGFDSSDGPYIINRESFRRCFAKKYAYSNTIENPFGNDYMFGSYDSNGAIIENGWIYGPDKKEIRYAPYELEGEFIIPDSVTSIGDNAFSNCKNLSSVIIPESVSKVGVYAFYNSGLKSVNLSSVKYIGRNAFEWCGSLKHVSLGWGLKSIKSSTFRDTGLIDIDIPNSVTEIDDYAFSDCNNLTSVFIPNSVTDIGKYAFYATGLKSVVIPNSIKELPEYVFYGCKSLSEIVIGNGIESIGQQALPPYIANLYITATTEPEPIQYLYSPDWNTLHISPKSDSSYRNNFWKHFSKREFLIDVSEVTLNKLSIKGHAGETFQLSATISPSNVTLPYIFWKSTHPEIAIVDNHGLVTLVKDVMDANDYDVFNKCKIICETLYADGPTAVVYVGDPGIKTPQSINWKQDFNDVAAGDSLKLSATTSSDLPVEYTSSDTNLATIENDIVTFLAPGTVTLTARQVGNELYLPAQPIEISVDIKPEPAKAIYLYAPSTYLYVNETYQLTVRWSPAEAPKPELEWRSENPEIATIDENGLLTALKEGETHIFVEMEIGKKDSSISQKVVDYCLVKIKDISPYQFIRWSQDFNNTAVGDSFLLSAKATSGLPVEYTSSDPNLATIENGIVTFLSPGTVTLTARQAGNEQYYPAQPLEILVDIKKLELHIDCSNIPLYVNETFQVPASFSPEREGTPELEWSSEDPEIASIDENGLLTALKEGTTKIFAMVASDHEIFSSCNVIIEKLPQYIEWEQDFNDVTVGDSFFLSATSSSGLPIEYVISSDTSDPEAEINENMVHFLKPGTISIFAYQNGNDTYKAAESVLKYIYVKPRTSPVLFIQINESYLTLKVNETYPLEVIFTPKDATDESIVWSSDDDSVATVDETGLVRAVKPGIAMISATTSNGLISYCKVTVSPVLVEKIILEPNEVQGVIGESFTINASVLPENATNPQLEWQSINPSVATVSRDGHVEIIKEGSCRIIVVATDGSDVSGECFLTGTSGIESIFAECGEHISIYTPSGLLIKKDCTPDDLKIIAPGLYILKSEQKTMSVIIR